MTSSTITEVRDTLVTALSAFKPKEVERIISVSGTNDHARLFTELGQRGFRTVDKDSLLRVRRLAQADVSIVVTVDEHHEETGDRGPFIRVVCRGLTLNWLLEEWADVVAMFDDMDRLEEGHNL